MIWPKEDTLRSRTQPSGPLCLWQCLLTMSRFTSFSRVKAEQVGNLTVVKHLTISMYAWYACCLLNLPHCKFAWIGLRRERDQAFVCARCCLLKAIRSQSEAISWQLHRAFVESYRTAGHRLTDDHQSNQTEPEIRYRMINDNRHGEKLHWVEMGWITVTRLKIIVFYFC